MPSGSVMLAVLSCEESIPVGLGSWGSFQLGRDAVGLIGLGGSGSSEK